MPGAFLLQQPTHFSTKLLCLLLILSTTQASFISVTLVENDETRNSSEEIATPVHQLNCTTNKTVCNDVCSEVHGSIPYSSTFCDGISGSCVCDCRDTVRKDCVETPFTPCFQDCVRKNPNPDVFLYKGANCPMSKGNGTVFYQCACGCSFRDDYEETNDIF